MRPVHPTAVDTPVAKENAKKLRRAGHRLDYVSVPGSERWSVENRGDLADLARSRFTSVAVITLEGRRLASQMALFSMADIIVAQHGAALANLLWARSGADVVEILSSVHIGSDLVPFYFSNLSAAMGLHHEVIHQPSDHGPVCVKDFAVLMDALAQSHDSAAGQLMHHSGAVATGGGFIPQSRP
ncbi:MAG: glycosyltransferase family 61 protein [Rhodobacteraceae bacterium]|nr:glycosyltransferase family 61 protein [Paracoccaceae bacterium]